jgi:hydroxymethylbilane synthase
MFVKEIEEALLTGAIDLAVHSAKDMPADQPEGLAIAGVLAREDPRDAIVLPSGTPPPAGLDGLSARLGPAPSIGTTSVRRAAQLAAALPGARFIPLRGNLDTRLRRLDGGQCDAAVLAAAGLRRLGFAGRVSWLVPFEICLPSPGQGIVAIEVRTDDVEVRRLVAAITDAPAARALEAERAVVTTLGGGCQMPLGAIALPDGDTLHLQGVVLSTDGREIVRAEARGSIRAPAAAGQRLARALLDQGARPLLERARDARQTGPQ